MMFARLKWPKATNMATQLVVAAITPRPCGPRKRAVMTVLINPYRFAERNFQTDPAGFGYSDEASSRTVVFIVSWIAVGVYTLVVWSMYKSMVKNFDMTIRRQSR